MLGFHPQFHIRLNQDGRFVSSTRRTHFTPQRKFLGAHFCQRLCGRQRLLSGDRNTKSVENFRALHQDSSPKSPFLWPGPSTNYATARNVSVTLFARNIRQLQQSSVRARPREVIVKRDMYCATCVMPLRNGTVNV